VDKVEQALAELALAQLRTEMAVQSMARDTEAFKNEMREFKDETRLDRKRMNKAWGDLANKPWISSCDPPDLISPHTVVRRISLSAVASREGGIPGPDTALPGRTPEPQRDDVSARRSTRPHPPPVGG